MTMQLTDADRQLAASIAQAFPLERRTHRNLRTGPARASGEHLIAANSSGRTFKDIEEEANEEVRAILRGKA
jgi:hypothetical protein